MTWILLAFGAAVFDAAKAAWAKRCLSHIDVYRLAWASRSFALVFLLPLFLFIEIPALSSEFWSALIISGLLNSLTTILFLQAVQRTDLSITMPMKAFAPFFLLFTSPLIIGEFPPLIGLVGIIIIISGSYLLELDLRQKGLLTPLKALLTNRGARLMLVVTFLWSISSNFNKIGVLASSSVFFTLSMQIFMTATLLPVMLLLQSKEHPSFRAQMGPLILLGLFSALVPLCQWSALKYTLVVYVLSLKRLSGVIGVYIGHRFFAEPLIRQRLIASLLMLLGVVILSLTAK